MNKDKPSKIKIVLIEDHYVTRLGLSLVLSEIDILEMVGEADSGLSGVAVVAARRPDVVLLDLGLPDIDGIECAKRIKSLQGSDKVHILMRTSHEENKAVIDTFSAGADGFCLKDCDDLVLISAIKDVFYGKTFLDPRIGVRLADFLSDSPNRHYLKDLYITSLDLEFLRSLPRPNDDARLKTILQKIAKIQL